MSSTVNHGISENNVKFEVHMQPPIEVPADVTSARVFVQSASIPYTTPNVTSSNNVILVEVPSDPTSDTTEELTITLPIGLYDIPQLERVFNHAVETAMQVEHLPAFPSPTGSTQALGFATFTPDFTTNRVVLTLNYNNSAILFSNSTSTFDVLGFTQDVRRGNIPVFHCLNMPEWTFVYQDADGQHANGTINLEDGDYTEHELVDHINALIATETEDLYTHPIVHLYVYYTTLADLPPSTLTHAPTAKVVYVNNNQTTSRYCFFTAGSNNYPWETTLGTRPYSLTAWNALTHAQQFDDYGCGIRFRGGLGVSTTDNNAWSIEGSTQQTYTASDRALIDRVTELGITVNPLVSGSVSADGTVSSGCLARFQVRGDIGSIQAFQPSNPLKIDMSQFIGQEIQKISVGLVDQNSEPITSLLDEHWSTNVVIELER